MLATWRPLPVFTARARRISRAHHNYGGYYERVVPFQPPLRLRHPENNGLPPRVALTVKTFSCGLAPTGIERFEQKKIWASTDLETLFGTNDEHVEPNLDALGEMANREEILAMARPYTANGAKELLKVCLGILEEREAEFCTLDDRIWPRAPY